MMEIGDLSLMRARIYLSDHEVSKAKVGAKARIQVDGSLKRWDVPVAEISHVSGQIDPILAEATEYRGLGSPSFYVVDLYIANLDATLKAGMTGSARVYGERRSILRFAWEAISRFLGRKLW